MHLSLKKPYLLFAEPSANPQTTGKIAMGLAHWIPHDCVGQLELPRQIFTLPGLQKIPLEKAKQMGAKTVIVCIANHGGTLKPEYIEVLKHALSLGFDIAAGLHEKLNAIPTLTAIAKRQNCTITDARHYTGKAIMATGAKRIGLRLLTVGTDCAVGKMFTALMITQEAKALGLFATFRATGQTGIFISGRGIPFDSIKTDFAAGAAETLSPSNIKHHWDVIEGQGSLFHPASGGSLALLHGSQPDALVLCHEPTRTYIDGTAHPVQRNLTKVIKHYETCARLTNPAAKVIAISINTQKLKEPNSYLNALEKKFEMPCIDPVKNGVRRVVNLMSEYL